MRRANKLTIIPIVFSSIFLSSCGTFQAPKYAADGPLNQKVNGYEESGHDLEATVNELRQKFEVPVGMDLEALSDRHAIAVNVPRGNVADVLNAIVAKQHGFKWAEVNGVVNIGPQRETNSILELRIAHFRVDDARYDRVHDAIVSLPEVKAWLDDNHLTASKASIVIGAVSPGRPFKPLVSLELQDATLREILNRIVKYPGYSAWTISRGEDGERKQYLIIGID
jgi:hypothetical protein